MISVGNNVLSEQHCAKDAGTSLYGAARAAQPCETLGREGSAISSVTKVDNTYFIAIYVFYWAFMCGGTTFMAVGVGKYHYVLSDKG